MSANREAEIIGELVANRSFGPRLKADWADEAWVPQLRRLDFRLGEIRLGSVALDSLVLTTHFLELVGQAAAEPRVPLERLANGTEMALAASYPIRERMPRLSILPQAIRYAPAQYERYYVDLSGSFEGYLDKFSAKSRATLRRKIRKFEEYSGGEIDWRIFQPETMVEFQRLAYPLSERTYQARLLGSGLPAFERFRTILTECGDARGYVLKHQGKTIAYIFCPVYDGNLHYEYVGYDSDYQQWSPGTVLQYLVLQSLFAEGKFRIFDFTEGKGAQKQFFGSQSVLCADIHYFKKTARNLLLVSLHSGLATASAATVRLLDRLGLKTRIKRLIRSKA
jgi:hypothetical protein